MFLNTAAWRTCGCPSLKGHQTRLDGALGRLVSQEFSGPMGRVEAGWCLKPLPTSVILWLVPILLAHHSRNFPLSTSCKVSLFSFSHLSHESKKKKKPKQSPNPAKSQNYQQLIIVSMFFPSFLCIWRIFEVSFHCLFSLQQKSSQICSGMDKPKISNTESATQRLCRRTAKLSFKLVAFLQKKFFMANFFFVCVDTVKQSYIKSAHPLILRAIFLI